MGGGCPGFSQLRMWDRGRKSRSRGGRTWARTVWSRVLALQSAWSCVGAVLGGMGSKCRVPLRQPCPSGQHPHPIPDIHAHANTALS